MKRKIISILLAFAFILSSFSMVAAGGLATPGNLKAKAIKGSGHKENGQTYYDYNISWKKVSGADDYIVTIYGNGSKKTRFVYLIRTSLREDCKPGTKISVEARQAIYKTRYYNSTTKKWQDKKPANKDWKGKRTRKVVDRYIVSKESKKIITKKP